MKIGKNNIFFAFFRSMEKMSEMDLRRAGCFFFSANLEPADIWGDPDFDFEILYLFDFFLIPNSQISRSQDFQVPRNLAWAGLGPYPKTIPTLVSHV